jgi:hypothetical protein
MRYYNRCDVEVRLSSACSICRLILSIKALQLSVKGAAASPLKPKGTYNPSDDDDLFYYRDGTYDGMSADAAVACEFIKAFRPVVICESHLKYCCRWLGLIFDLAFSY